MNTPLIPYASRRRPRVILKGKHATYHCVSRINGQLHLLDHTNMRILRDLMHRVSAFCGIKILTFCILNNHYHILLCVPEKIGHLGDKALLKRAALLYGHQRPRQKLSLERISRALEEGGSTREAMRALLINRMGSLPMFMKILNQRFSIIYNRSNARCGTLWEDRFKSVLVQPSTTALATIAAYIDLNPVRAGIVDDPKDYPFSGYGESIGKGKPNALPLYEHIARIAGTDRDRVHRHYRMLLFATATEPATSRGKKPSNQATLSPEKARAVLAKGGHLSPAELMRCRVRYLTDGMIIGSKAYIEEWFRDHRHLFPASRRTAARKLRGGEWNQLHCARNLTHNILS